MKKIIQLVSIATLFLSLSSCKGNVDETKKDMQSEKEGACFYSYNSGSTVLEWTAFKFTEKTPVKGTFNEIKIEGMEKSDNPKKLIESIKFTISTVSVETNNDERNGKIAKLFFGTINTENITGEVKSLGSNGKASIMLQMNNHTHEIIGEYTLEGGKFSFHSVIDVMKWNSGKGLKALNDACKDLHTSTDGKSKLWSEVEIAFTTELMSDCD